MDITKGRSLMITANTVLIASSALLFSISGFAAEEMDHSQHQNMDHSQHQAMDHSEHQHTAASQAGQHVHHGHGAGQWMFEYRYMSMDMEDLLDGDSSVDPQDIAGMNMGTMMTQAGRDYMMTATSMTMDMHMLMLMYGFSEKLSGMVMFNYLDNEMDMVMPMFTAGGVYMPNNDRFMDMSTSGMGDTQVGAMYQMSNELTASLMLNVPTGATDEKVDDMNGNERVAPYGMQLGSGTYDLIPSITYNTSSGPWVFGGQAQYTLHTGENDEGYTIGDKLELSGWAKYAVNKMFTVAGRLNYMDQDEIDGENEDIPTMMGGMFMAPTDDPDNYGGNRIDLAIEAMIQSGGHSGGISYAFPVQQDVNGIQLEMQSILTISYQYMM